MLKLEVKPRPPASAIFMSMVAVVIKGSGYNKVVSIIMQKWPDVCFKFCFL